MNTSIIGLLLLVCTALVWLMPTLAPGAIVMCALVSVPTIFILARTHDERTFLFRVFFVGLLVRIILASVINMGHMEDFFGGDANTYDIFGRSLLQGLHGDGFHMGKYESFVASGAGAWGMLYLVAGIYEVVGRNLLAVQLVNASIGAATGIVVYYNTMALFNNVRAAKLAALLVTFFPSLRSDGFHMGKYESFVASGAGAWGMLYLVAGIYEVVGRNLLAVQLVNASIGAATGIVVYHNTMALFNNVRAAKLAALLVTFFPSL